LRRLQKMKYLLIFILSLSILHSSLKDAVTYASYIVNIDYIATTLCINRNDSGPLCKGKCVLKESLQSNHESEDRIPAKLNEDRTITFYWPVKLVSFSELMLSSMNKSINYQEILYFFSFHKNLLRPPQ